MTDPTPLSDGTIFAWGALGGFIALAVVQILPAAFSLVHGQPLVITLGRVIGALLVIAIFVGAGGAAALIVGDDLSRTKDALVYGMAWESIIGGAIKTGRAALPPAP